MIVNDSSCSNVRDSWNYHQLSWPFERALTQNVDLVRWAHMVEMFLARVEYKEIDISHCEKWVSTDFSSPNVDAIFPSK